MGVPELMGRIDGCPIRLQLFHGEFIARLEELCELSHPEDRDAWSRRAFPRLLKNQEIRLRINVAKTEAVEALLEVLELMSEDLGCIEVQEGQLMFID